MIVLIGILIAFLVMFLIFLRWIIKAPIGYEDDDGFHYGEK